MISIASVVLACAKAPAKSPGSSPQTTVSVGKGSDERDLQRDLQRDLIDKLDRIVHDHRATIVLLADEPVAGVPETTVAWLVHERMQEGLDALSERLSLSPAGREIFLGRLENEPTWRDGDKLAFKDLLSELPASPRLDHDRQVLQGIQNRYDAEVKLILGRLPTRGMVDRREAWEDYLASVRASLTKEALLAELDPIGGQVVYVVPSSVSMLSQSQREVTPLPSLPVARGAFVRPGQAKCSRWTSDAAAGCRTPRCSRTTPSSRQRSSRTFPPARI